MPTSEETFACRAVGCVLLTATLALYATWSWLRDPSLPPGADGDFVLGSEGMQVAFFDAVRARKHILFLGTSESLREHNLGNQLNALAPDAPRMVTVAKAGLSPIHNALVMARAQREGMRFPPLVLVINPVYFTHSHDRVNDGWLSTVFRSPAFLLMNHRQVRDGLSQEARQAYDRYFRLRRLLGPVTAQEYLGNLLYLRAHPVSAKQVDQVLERALRVRTYRFDGKLPDYDPARGVWKGYRASDQMRKSRWLVRRVEESVNLRGLASALAVLRAQEAPALVLMLPANRAFYTFNGLDMGQYEQRYRAIREAVRAMAEAPHLHFIDLYSTPSLHFGFADRMHQDAYGFFQLARYLVHSEPYRRFIEAVRDYYGIPPTGAGVRQGGALTPGLPGR